MHIFIDSKELDTYPDTKVEVSFDATSFAQPDKKLAVVSKSFAIPATTANRKIMGDIESVNCVDRFNDKEHIARIEHNGCQIIRGQVVLMSISIEENRASYNCRFILQEPLWVTSASKKLIHESQIDFACVANADTIAQSWEWNQPVRFLPVMRSNTENFEAGSELISPSKILCFEDYHPFIQVKAVLESIFRSEGYEIRSEFFSSRLFDSLYFSGNYPSQNVAVLKSKMDFKAGNFADKTAVADSLGCVYANPVLGFNSIGNIVDTANPFEIDNNLTVSGVFSNGGCLTKRVNQLEFKPVQEVTVAFELGLKYKSDYLIASRQELKCFNTICFQQGDTRRFKIANRNKDRRERFRENFSFMKNAFWHTAGGSYRFQYDRITNPQADPENLSPGDIATYNIDFSQRSSSVSIPAGQKAVNPRLTVRQAGSAGYVAYTGDWALYDGYVTERGKVDVEMKVRTRSSVVKPSSPKYFDMIYFGGAEPGMEFTLSDQTTLRPIFTPAAGEGSQLEFKDIAAHSFSQIDLVNAIGHMFNLSFHTDESDRIVYIEPEKDFSPGSRIIDWNVKTDTSKPVVIQEMGEDYEKTISLLYKDGDARTIEYNIAHQTKLGKWSVATSNQNAKPGEKKIANPLFTTAINIEEALPDAPSASVVVVGDSNSNESDLNFKPRIVCYTGMKILPDSEIWGWPSQGASYPHLAFHDPENNVSLCFEDRGEAEGLHSYYAHRFEARENGRRITAYMNLAPMDIEQITFIDNPNGDIRCRFRINIAGENCVVKLEKIEHYSPDGGSTKCTFVKA